VKARTKAVLRPPITRLLNRYRPGALPDIALVSSPRSGSTWLMELLASCPGVSYRDEPDHRSMIDTHQLLEINTRWSYGSLSPAERKAFVDYLSDDARVRLFGPTSPRCPGWQWQSDRRVLKIIRMTSVIDLFPTDLGYDTVYLVRHPIAQALSSLKRGHLSRLDCYLGDAHFLASLPDDEMRDQAWRTARSGNDLESLLVDWCLANRNPLTAGPDAPWFSCSYETLTLTPDAVLPELWAFLRLPDVNNVRRRVRVPSKNADPRHTSAITGGNASRARMVSSWHSVIDRDEEKRLMEIVAVFGIDLYRAGSDLPVTVGAR
jgi:hypothetical protein